MQDLAQQAWFQYLTSWQQKLVRQAHQLLVREQENQTLYDDYSFIVFPMAKAYEGFLKKLLFDQGLITQHVYEGKRFRIGRALNPDIREHQRDKWWLYDNVERKCGSKTARFLWETWLACRNRVFHFFPKAKASLELSEASQRLQMMRDAMRQAVACLEDSEN
ncbi:MAG: hypothetical protein GF390_02230 [Candidatus Pacebacteria bacterium]|nr:hypothetical protein [Candidatus Paceibacterota bacterium]